MNNDTIASIFLVLLLVINLYGMALTGIDKKRAIKNQWRIPERRIFLICWLGGAVGVYFGLLIFHHKIRRMKFMVGIPFIFLFEMICLLGAIYLVKML